MSVDQKLPPPIHPGAPQASPYSLMFGLRALAACIICHSYPTLQFTAPRECSMLDSDPSVELVSPPISTLKICRLAP